MKKFSLAWTVGLALLMAIGNSFAQSRDAGEIHRQEGHTPRPGMDGRGRVDHHEFGERHGFHRHVPVIIGSPFWWAPPLALTPPLYIEPGSAYAYYCRDPAGYYPDIQYCPSEWLRVVPDPG